MTGSFDPWQAYVELSWPEGRPRGEGFVALQLPGRMHDYIAHASDDEPALLVSLETAPSVVRAPVRLEYLEVSFNAPCRIAPSTGPVIEGRFAVVRCTSTNWRLKEYFVRAVTPLIESLPVEPSAADVSAAMNDVVELFKALESPQRGSAKGIWGELFVIYQSADPIAVAKAWRCEGSEKFDFSLAEERLEVKTTESSRRAHRFSLDQLEPPAGTTAYVASLLVRSAVGGLSVLNLVKAICARLGDRTDLAARIWSNITMTLGEGWEEALEIRFDEHHASEHLRFFLAEMVPRVTKPANERVFDITFRSDLSDIPALDIHSYSGPLISSVHS